MNITSALLIVDVQNDFCAGGALAVPDAEAIIPVLNNYIEQFMQAGQPIYASRDWHPPVTRHFKAYGGIWPPHCIQGTKGAEFHPDLKLPNEAEIISKGMAYDADSYSAFEGVDSQGRKLAVALRERGIDHLYIGGLATDYCVKHTAFDALKAGFHVTILEDAVRGVNEADSAYAIEELLRLGATKGVFQDVTHAAA
ncbi:MAG: nicotinamidase [Acidobacteriota bacterium]|nr:nicotinamidase [Blastocatellia bacterium]MDW8238974.1 nicotinamidase [Acidobacteriota bacterium]